MGKAYIVEMGPWSIIGIVGRFSTKIFNLVF